MVFLGEQKEFYPLEGSNNRLSSNQDGTKCIPRNIRNVIDDVQDDVQDDESRQSTLLATFSQFLFRPNEDVSS